jgi:flagellar basal body P-ring formation protein FlgA
MAWLVLALLPGVTSVWAEPGPNTADPVLAQALQAAVDLVRDGGHLPDRTRLEVVPGSLDPRLRLAPCQKVQPYLPPGAPPWGRTRVGLKCTAGPVPWNVYLPVTVKVWAPVLTARHALAAGALLQANDLVLVEGDLAEQASPAHREVAELAGRQLAQALAPGAVVRDVHLRTRSWFQSGEQVTIVAAGNGFGATATGQALSQGIEGQVVRVRTDSGRVILAWPVAENRVELRL